MRVSLARNRPSVVMLMKFPEPEPAPSLELLIVPTKIPTGAFRVTEPATPSIKLFDDLNPWVSIEPFLARISILPLLLLEDKVVMKALARKEL